MRAFVLFVMVILGFIAFSSAGVLDMIRKGNAREALILENDNVLNANLFKPNEDSRTSVEKLTQNIEPTVNRTRRDGFVRLINRMKAVNRKIFEEHDDFNPFVFAVGAVTAAALLGK